MAGVLFVVYIPCKEHEYDLKRNNKTTFNNEKGKVDESSPKPNISQQSLGIYQHADANNVIITKYKSTDCLHGVDTADALYKSEINLNIEKEGDKGHMRTSWGGIKQVIHMKKKKLKINKTARAVDIRDAFHSSTPLETILSEIVERLCIQNAAWIVTKDNKFWQVTFGFESGELCEELLQVLRAFGIGSKYHSSVSVMPCALFYKSNENYNQSEQYGEKYTNIHNESSWSRFSTSVRARNNLAQVLHDVRSEATLTFDWIFLLLVAAFVAAIGLIENSTVMLVASMLISPLMTPITAGTLGIAVKDSSLQRMGLKLEIFGLFLSLVIGFVFGMGICIIDNLYNVLDEWPTSEMTSRCELRSLWIGVLVAIPSGAAVALAVLSEYTASLVGVAISASLLPPAVNAGLLWAMSLVRLLFPSNESRWSVAQPDELALLGIASLCLTLINIVCIFLAGVGVYKIKQVSPLSTKDIWRWKASQTLLQFSNKVNERCSNEENNSRNGEIFVPLDPKIMTDHNSETENITKQKRENIFPRDTVLRSLNNPSYGQESLDQRPTTKSSLNVTVDSKGHGKMNEKTCFNV